VDHWRYLNALLEHAPSHAEQELRRPCRVPLPDVKVFSRLLAAAARNKLAALLAGHVLSALAARELVAGWAPEALGGLLAALFPGRILPPVEQTSWLTAPLPVIQGDTGKLVYLLAGLLPEGGSIYASGNLTPACRRYAEQALALFSAMHPGFAGSLVLIPLLKADGASITGGSLGLPLALALHLLHTRRPWPEGFYASGCLNRQGKILPVDGLVEKCSVLAAPRCLFFAARDAARYSGPAYVNPVATLSQAIEDLEFILLQEDPGKAALFRTYLHGPLHFLAHFNELPPAFLRHDKSRGILKEINNRPFEFLPLVTAALHGCTFEPSRAALLTALYDDGQLLAMPTADDATREVEIFVYSIARIAHANHIGDTAAVETWTKIQHRHSRSITTDDRLLALNHHFIAERFNCYAFRDDIPRPIVDLLEKVERTNRILSDANRNLGAMYGTLCQNFGFCGPGYLAGLLAYKEKAANAFNRKFKAESRRLESYEFYGRLETGEKRDAVKALNRYLELPATAETEEWLGIMKDKLAPGAGGDLFTLSAILRALVDLDTPLSADQLENIHSLLYDNLPAAGHHPWQLMLFNLARLLAGAGKRGEVAECLDRMVDVCNLGKETMQAMGLLAYSELHLQGLAEKRHYRAAEQLLEKMQQNRYLNQAHFAPLYLPVPLERKLRLLVDHRPRFFPFTYR
jgi:hypothetical protein